MHRHLLILGLVAVVKADLTCLSLGFVLLPLGLFCHFKHDTFNAVENATVQDIESFASDVTDAVEFRIEHHPLVLGYDWASTAISNGTADANGQLKDQVSEEVKVDIGFAKEIVNTDVNVFQLTNWYDVAFCLIVGAKNLSTEASGPWTNTTSNLTSTPSATSASIVLAASGVTGTGSNENSVDSKGAPIATSRMKRSADASFAAAQAIVHDCANQKFRQLARPAVFNITDPDEKIGSTLAQLALFFVPVGPEGEAAEVALNGFDLAIPGSEDAGRIYKMAAKESQHFATEEEAMAVQDRLSDADWIDSNCVKTCTPPAGTRSAKRKRSAAHDEIVTRLRIRGSAFSMCCELPDIIPPLLSDFDVPDPNGDGQELVQQSVPYHDPRRYGIIPETDLMTPPALETWSDAVASKESILLDLEQKDAALVAWSSSVKDIISSEELFQMLRRAFNPTSAEDSAFADAMGIGNMELASDISPGRKTTATWGWSESSKDPNMMKLQAFTDAAMAQAKDMVTALKGFDDANAASLKTSMDIYYIPPGAKAIKNPDPRGLHTDGNILQLAAADQPGLVVQHGTDLFRTPKFDDTWQLLKCNDWDRANLKLATAHTVFGPDIVKNGRVSLIVNVFLPFKAS